MFISGCWTIRERGSTNYWLIFVIRNRLPCIFVCLSGNGLNKSTTQTLGDLWGSEKPGGLLPVTSGEQGLKAFLSLFHFLMDFTV